MATGKKKSARAKRVFTAQETRRRARLGKSKKKAKGGSVTVTMARTKRKRVRFKLPSGKWSPSYANLGAARRAAKRVFSTKTVIWGN